MKHSKQLESCVFYFFNENKPEQQKRIKKQKIHKIVQNDFFIQNELTNQKKLLKVPNRRQYFYLCENTSELKLTHIDENDKKIKKINSKKDDTILLEFEERQLIYLKNYLKRVCVVGSLSSSTKYIITIIIKICHY